MIIGSVEQNDILLDEDEDGWDDTYIDAFNHQYSNINITDICGTVPSTDMTFDFSKQNDTIEFASP